jgi:hypothetical protein
MIATLFEIMFIIYIFEFAIYFEYKFEKEVR